MIGTKYVEKYFVNDLETQDDANGLSSPVDVEIRAIVSILAHVAIEGVNHNEGDNLRNNVGKEDREFSVDTAPQHDPSQ